MKSWLWLIFCFVMFAAEGAVEAQSCQAPMIPFTNGVGPFSGKNFVNYDLEISSFPDSETDPATGQTVTGLHSQLDSSLAAATSLWNQACRGPLVNKYPLLLHSNISLPSAGSLPIRFQPGLQDVDVKRCPPPNQRYNCYPPAATQWNGVTGEPMALVIYGRYGDSKEGIAHPTLVHFSTRFEGMLTHEIGHTLGLDHNNCPASYMRGDGSLYDGQPKMIGGAECSSLADSHSPPDPLQPILDENERCRLENYCQLDPRIPWPALRPFCTWVAITEGGETSSFVRYHYFCIGGGRGIDPPSIPEDIFGPRILIDYPRPQEPVMGMLQVRGWAWEASRGLREVKVWLDGIPAVLQGFS